MNNFIPHLIMDELTYPGWDQSKSMLIKGSMALNENLYQNLSRNALQIRNTSINTSNVNESVEREESVVQKKH